MLGVINTIFVSHAQLQAQRRALAARKGTVTRTVQERTNKYMHSSKDAYISLPLHREREKVITVEIQLLTESVVLTTKVHRFFHNISA